jgi:3-oxoacyl-ACP reductase-like protein
MNSVPSAVDVMLSGNAWRPGSAIDCASATAACGATTLESTATVTAKRATHGFNLILDATAIDVSAYDTGGFLSKVGAL